MNTTTASSAAPETTAAKALVPAVTPWYKRPAFKASVFTIVGVAAVTAGVCFGIKLYGDSLGEVLPSAE